MDTQDTGGNQRAADLPRRLLWVAYFIGAFGLAMNHQFNFLIPLRARELGASFEVIGLIVGVGALVPAIMSVPLGMVIDRLGPRRSFILGAGLCGVVSVALMAVTNYWLFLVLLPMGGTARTLGWVASQSYITSLGRVQDRATLAGRFALFSNLGPMVAPLIVGGVAQVAGFQLAFGWLAIWGFGFALTGWLLVETGSSGTAGRKTSGVGFRAALRLLVIRGMQVALLLTFVRLWIEWAWNTFYALYLVESGVQPAVAGTVVSAKGLVAMLVAPSVGYFVRYASKEKLTCLGLGLGALGLVLSPHLAVVPLVYLAPLLVGIGTGVSLPLLLNIVSEAAPDGQRGIALGLRNTVNQIAGTAAPVLVGPMIAGLGIALAFGTGGLVAASLLGVALALHLRGGPSGESRQAGAED